MGRAYSKAAKLKAKKALKDEFALAETPRREKDGNTTRRKRTAELRQERDPARTALQARARQMGVKNWKALRAQALGEAAGQAIYLYVEEEITDAGKRAGIAADMWAAYAGLTNAEARYHRVCLGKSMAAKVAKVEYFPEVIEAKPDEQPDLRDDDEKHRDAKNAWDKWLGHLNELSLGDSSIIQSVSRGWTDPMIDGKLTLKGRLFAKAVERLSERVD